MEYDAHAVLTKSYKNILKITAELRQILFSKDLMHLNNFFKK